MQSTFDPTCRRRHLWQLQPAAGGSPALPPPLALRHRCSPHVQLGQCHGGSLGGGSDKAAAWRSPRLQRPAPRRLRLQLRRGSQKRRQSSPPRRSSSGLSALHCCRSGAAWTATRRMRRCLKPLDGRARAFGGRQAEGAALPELVGRAGHFGAGCGAVRMARLLLAWSWQGSMHGMRRQTLTRAQSASQAAACVVLLSAFVSCTGVLGAAAG